MKIDNNLNVYKDEDYFLPLKSIYKKCIIFFIVGLCILGILTAFFPFIYSIIIGYFVGSILSTFLLHITNKWVNETYYKDLRKISRKIHLLHQLIYVFSFAIFGAIFQSYWIVIGLVLGFLLVKFSILLSKIK